jgi:LacI family transcriptional regulator
MGFTGSGTTLHDVAALAGVSPRTVSRVVNDEGGFGEATRQRVLDAIDKVGYRPNLLARALITKRTGTIGLVVPQMNDPYFSELAEGVQAAARATGRTMFIASHGEEVSALNDILETLSSFAVDGVIVFAPLGDRSTVIAHASRGLATVLVDLETEAPNLGSVVSALSNGAEMAVDHLVSRGRTRIAMIANANSEFSALPARREAGFRRGLHNADLSFDQDLVERQPPTIEGGRAAMEKLLARRPSIDGVFAYNDAMAIGALQALATARRRVPDDVAIVGFDDIAICAALVPALTTVRLDSKRIGEEAIAMLERIAAAPDVAQPTVTLDVQVVARAST